MSQDSAIEWTDKTWNPTRGCRRVSPGCERCYAEKVAHRFSGPGLPYDGLVALGKSGPRWTGDVRFVRDALDAPLGWRKPAKIFVNSMSDLFYEEFLNDAIAAVFGAMAACPRHTFQVLTKRADRLPRWYDWVSKQAREVNDGRGMSEAAFCLAMAQQYCQTAALAKNVSATCAREWPLSNVWLGVSVEDQQRAEERIPHLLRTPAAVRFVSYEPALGPVDFERIVIQKAVDLGPDISIKALTGWYGGSESGKRTHLDWMIVGGESGIGARPFDLAWARSAVEQCKEAGVPVFVKQLGSWPRELSGDSAGVHHIDWEVRARDPFRLTLGDRKGGDMASWPHDLRVRQFPGGAK